MAYQNKKSFISLQTSPPFPVLSFAKIIVHGKISKTNKSYRKIINTKNMEKDIELQVQEKYNIKEVVWVEGRYAGQVKRKFY